MDSDPPVIVAEVSKNWPNDDKTPVSKLFERVINVNISRGYQLRDWQFSQIIQPESETSAGGIVETIVAVFETCKLPLTTASQPPTI